MEWDLLRDGQPSASPFMRWAWQSSWWRAYGSGKQPWVIEVRDGQGLAALAPFFRSKEYGMSVLRPIGWRRFDDFDFLLRAGAEGAIEALGTALRKDGSWAAIELLPWSGSEHTLSEFLAGLGSSMLKASRVYENCPAIIIEGRWEDYLAKKKSSFRKWTRKLERVALEGEMTSVEVVAGSDLNRNHILELLDLEKRSAHWEAGTAHFADDRFVDLLHELLEFPDHGLEARLLRSGERLIAAEILIDADNSLLGLWTTFDQERRLTGNFILMDALRSGFDRGRRVFDFLQGDESYKLKWSNSMRSVEQVVLCRLRPTAAVFWLLSRLRWGIANSSRLRSLAERYRP